MKASKLHSGIVWAVLAGFIAGLVVFVVVRFITYKSDDVHYHANFALYINGQRDEFKNFTFYEEIQSCGSDEHDNPKTRAHLHDNNNHVIHVHAPGVTWGHFFANLGYTLDDALIKTDNGVFIDGQDGNHLTFMLNGKPVSAIANETIRSKDALLINYGQDSEATLKQHYDRIPKDADSYNKRNDPSSCSGSKHLNFGERLKKAIGIPAR